MQPQGRNPLTIPLIAVSVVAALEGVALIVLFMRHGPTTEPISTVTLPPMTAVQGSATVASPYPTSAPAKPLTVPRGKAGERVESAGFGITVEKILDKPATYPQLVMIGPDQQYLALLVLVENDSGGNAGLFPSMFRLQDEQGFEYEQLGIHGPCRCWNGGPWAIARRSAATSTS